MIFGYMRVSTTEQNLQRQEEELLKYVPKENIISDMKSGKDFDREGWKQLDRQLRKDDTLIIKELDRIGRNKTQIKEELQKLQKKGVKVVILNIPTTKMLLDNSIQNTLIIDMINNILIEVLSTIAEEERIKIKSRQAEGIAIAKKLGKKTGREPTKITPRIEKILQEVKEGTKTKSLAAKELDTSRSHIDRLLKREAE
jgi:DNA invertase Pin-like site-specific DNA recombinase